jgi:hypothetical protein
VAQNDYYCLIDNTNNTSNFEKARHVSIWDKNLGADEATRFLRKLSNNVQTIIFQGEIDQLLILINPLWKHASQGLSTCGY